MITSEYQFPKITERMYIKLREWYEEHNNGKCSSKSHGAIGGSLSFEIIPTSIGEIVEAKCNCGETHEMMGL